MDYKRVLKLHFENGYSGRTIAKNTGEGQRTAINEFLKRFKECEELSWPLSEEVTNEYIEPSSCLQHNPFDVMHIKHGMRYRSRDNIHPDSIISKP